MFWQIRIRRVQDSPGRRESTEGAEQEDARWPHHGCAVPPPSRAPQRGGQKGAGQQAQHVSVHRKHVVPDVGQGSQRPVPQHHQRARCQSRCRPSLRPAQRFLPRRLHRHPQCSGCQGHSRQQGDLRQTAACRLQPLQSTPTVRQGQLDASASKALYYR